MTTAILLAAGNSSRMGFDKITTPLGGKSSLLWCAAAMAEAGVNALLVVGSETSLPYLKGLPYPLPVSFCLGGSSRGESVRNALACLQEQAPDTVVIHDGDRPFVPASVIEASILSAQKTGSGVAALKLTDTLLQQGTPPAFPDRSRFCRTQTPQSFQFKRIYNAYRQNISATDDASLYAAAYGSVELVEGSEDSRKLTSVEDWQWARQRLSTPRYGNGFDTHVLAAGRKLVLGGLELPYEKGLMAHSDGDVLLHAIMDALLGAANLGDIGKNFPDSDQQYKNISSRLLLRQVRDKLLDKGYSIGSIDATVLAQAPKLNPHFDRMRALIAEDLNISAEQISLKATTTEGMNDEGRGLCISVYATAVLFFLG